MLFLIVQCTNYVCQTSCCNYQNQCALNDCVHFEYRDTFNYFTLGIQLAFLIISIVILFLSHTSNYLVVQK
ncbi:unnamed protein product [Paramecium pentaurelia]|uniref:Uncharacterized protein n=1 Tax=Paramecium pentaurelia TaxID=43138 RepID=A0A8S1VSN0_9CILI|nr:unnamed protein product [Paramecium pentaurelia]